MARRFSLYQKLWPLLRLADAERAHRAGLRLLQSPIAWGCTLRDAQPFCWQGLRVRNRIGIAAGFDKDAQALRGMAGLGAGFAEVGTVLNRPWPGNPAPRLRRIPGRRALWNRLGFPSAGLAQVQRRLARGAYSDLAVGCNIAPHPLTLRENNALPRARAELAELVEGLHPHAAFFTINLSSPNTRGLRAQFYGADFSAELVAPTRECIARLDARAGRAATPLLVKLPPEDAAQQPFCAESFAALLQPLLSPGVCDGFVAVNSSARLARRRSGEEEAALPGGISAAPLLPVAEALMRWLSALAPDHLRIGCGGVMSPGDAHRLQQAGAHLVEIYTGLIYCGPALIADCAAALSPG